MTTATKKGYTVLSAHELNEMRARANLIEKCNLPITQLTQWKVEMFNSII